MSLGRNLTNYDRVPGEGMEENLPSCCWNISFRGRVILIEQSIHHEMYLLIYRGIGISHPNIWLWSLGFI